MAIRILNWLHLLHILIVDILSIRFAGSQKATFQLLTLCGDWGAQGSTKLVASCWGLKVLDSALCSFLGLHSIFVAELS